MDSTSVLSEVLALPALDCQDQSSASHRHKIHKSPDCRGTHSRDTHIDNLYAAVGVNMKLADKGQLDLTAEKVSHRGHKVTASICSRHCGCSSCAVAGSTSQGHVFLMAPTCKPVVPQLAPCLQDQEVILPDLLHTSLHRGWQSGTEWPRVPDVGDPACAAWCEQVTARSSHAGTILKRSGSRTATSSHVTCTDILKLLRLRRSGWAQRPSADTIPACCCQRAVTRSSGCVFYALSYGVCTLVRLVTP